MAHLYPITIHTYIFMTTFPASIFNIKYSMDKSDPCATSPKLRPAVAVKHDGPDAGLTGEVILLNAGEAQKWKGGCSVESLSLRSSISSH